MNSVLTSLKNAHQKRKRYHEKAEKTIAAEKLYMMMLMSLITFLLLIAFFFLTPYIIEDWKPTIYDLMFLPISLICSVVSYFDYKRNL